MKRNRCIDIAKGISIICIVLGHLGEDNIKRVVFTFHVPLFFLLTGYFINKETVLNLYIRKRFRRLIIPYIVTSAAVIILALAVNQFTRHGVGDRELLFRWLMAAFYGAGDTHREPFLIPAIGAIWFLLASFWGSILLRWLLNLKKELQCVFVFGIFGLSVISARRLFWLPFSIQAGGGALLFMHIGYLGKEIVPAFRKADLQVKIFTGVFLLWGWLDFIYRYQGFLPVNCDFGRGAADIAESICGCCCVLLLSCGIDRFCNTAAKGLAFMGRNSLTVLCLHLVELDVFPWKAVVSGLFGEITNIQYLWFRIVFKFLWIILMTLFITKLKSFLESKRASLP